MGIGHGCCYREDSSQDLDWDGFYSVRRWIFFGIGGKHALQAEIDGTACVEARVYFTQLEERLANRP